MKRTTGERWTGHFSPRPRQSAACLAVLSSSHRFILPCRYISTPLSTDPSPVRIATLHSIPASVSSERRQVVTASACRRVCTLVSDRRKAGNDHAGRRRGADAFRCIDWPAGTTGHQQAAEGRCLSRGAFSVPIHLPGGCMDD